MALTTGQILQNRYRILRPLGQGGMGAVYLAEDTRLGSRCAIKESVPDPNAGPAALAQMRAQFQLEARTLAALSHPNLPKVTDYFSEAGNEYLVMEYVEGEDLASVLARHSGPLPEKPVLIWADQVLDALDYLHSQPNPIIHRDIKPANIILTPQGKVKLVDFGLVKLYDPTNPRTATAMKGMGTPEYTPLEQYAGGAGHTDARSDIYALGATLYHLLTGVTPANAPQRSLNAASLLAPRQVVPALSPGTEAAVLKAMAVHPDQRFAKTGEMRLALQGHNTSVVPIGGGRPPIQRRIPFRTWGTAMVGLLIVTLITWQLARAVPLTVPTPTVVTVGVRVVPVAGTVVPSPAMTWSPTTSVTATPKPVMLASLTADISTSTSEAVTVVDATGSAKASAETLSHQVATAKAQEAMIQAGATATQAAWSTTQAGAVQSTAAALSQQAAAQAAVQTSLQAGATATQAAWSTAQARSIQATAAALSQQAAATAAAQATVQAAAVATQAAGTSEARSLQATAMALSQQATVQAAAQATMQAAAVATQAAATAQARSMQATAAALSQQATAQAAAQATVQAGATQVAAAQATQQASARATATAEAWATKVVCGQWRKANCPFNGANTPILLRCGTNQPVVVDPTGLLSLYQDGRFVRLYNPRVTYNEGFVCDGRDAGYLWEAERSEQIGGCDACYNIP